MELRGGVDEEEEEEKEEIKRATMRKPESCFCFVLFLSFPSL